MHFDMFTGIALKARVRPRGGRSRTLRATKVELDSSQSSWSHPAEPIVVQLTTKNSAGVSEPSGIFSSIWAKVPRPAPAGSNSLAQSVRHPRRPTISPWQPCVRRRDDVSTPLIFGPQDGPRPAPWSPPPCQEVQVAVRPRQQKKGKSAFK